MGRFDDCARCGAELSDEVIMIGGYRAALCTGCRNDWHRHVMGSPIAVEHHDLATEATVLLVRSQADGVDRFAEIRELTRRGRACEATLFELAEAWIKADRPS